MKLALLILFTSFISVESSDYEVVNNCRSARAHKGNSNQDTLQPSRLSTPDLRHYLLKWTDNFDGKKLNTVRWHYADSGKTRGFGKMLKSNVVVSNGTLKLFAEKQVSDGKASFSAAMISSERSFHQRYGYFEVRARMNTQVGPHGAFWLLAHSVGEVHAKPNPSIYGAEIDVFEYHRAEGINNIYMSLHWNGYNYSNGSHQTVGKKFEIPGISTGFHVFALEWTPREYAFYVDGVELARTSIAISHTPQFLLLSTEINGFGGDRFQMIDNVPDFLEIDYVKAYEYKQGVTLFGDCNYYGWASQRLIPGLYTADDLKKNGVNSNEVSSIIVPRGWRVVAYDGDQFKGDSIVISTDRPCIQLFNDRVSSVKIISTTNH